jgi:GNAT superfamily N-acetyltransferase
MPEPVIRPMRQADIDVVRQVGQRTWADVASKDVGHKVRYPMRPRKVVEAYMWKEPEGCLVAEDRGDVIASAFCHVWGRVGWVGPFEVLPERQNMGVGTKLMLRCEDYLRSRGCTVLGLETMPYFVRNLHFYLRLGYMPSEMTFVVEKSGMEKAGGSRAEELEKGSLGPLLPSIRSLSSRLCEGLDYSGEFEMTVERGLGTCLVLREGRSLSAGAIVHTYYPPDETDHVTLRLLVVNPDTPDQEGVFSEMLEAVEGVCARSGRKRLFARFSSKHSSLYPLFLSSGYKLDAANFRLVKGRCDERPGYHVSAWAG